MAHDSDCSIFFICNPPSDTTLNYRTFRFVARWFFEKVKPLSERIPLHPDLGLEGRALSGYIVCNFHAVLSRQVETKQIAAFRAQDVEESGETRGVSVANPIRQGINFHTFS